METLKPNPARIGVGGFEFTQHERQYLERVFATNILSYGPLSQEFEERFAEAHQVKHAILCNSGTSALHLGLLCLKELHGWKSDAEVILPALTFVATLNMVLEAGLRPMLVDVDPKTYNINPAAVAEAITDKTVCILPVHLFGQPCAMTEIGDLAKKHRVAILEDSAETMFARFDGQSVGSFGEIGCFSTYIAHLLVMGVGGIVTTSSDEIAAMIRSLMNHGRDPVYLSANVEPTMRSENLQGFLKSQFRFLRRGFSYRVTEMEAALGLGQLDQMPAFLESRKKNAAQLSRGLADLEHVLQLPTTHPQAEHRYMMYPIVLRDAAVSKWDLMEFLEKHNIETREMLPLTNQPVYRGRLSFPKTPVTDWINGSGLYIGCHPFLTEKDIDFQIRVIRKFFAEGGR